MIEIAIALAGLWIAYSTYKKSFPSKPPEPLEEKANLLVNYKMTQRLSLEVQDLLQSYINKGNAEKEMYPNITFQQFLDLSRDEFDKSLSDKLHDELKVLDMSRSNIVSMLKMIETQNKALTELRTQLIFLNHN